MLYRLSVWGLLAVASCALTSVGCAGSQPVVRLPDIEEFDPKEPAVVHAGYRFRLSRPADDWTLLGENQARALHPQLSAAAVQPATGASVLVMVEQLDLDLDAALSMYMEVLELDPATRESQRIRHQGIDAVTFGGVVRRGDTRFDVRALLLIHRGHAYSLRVVAQRQGTSNKGLSELYQAALRSFSLLSGPVRAKVLSSGPRPDVRGPDWRLTDGVYVSAGSGLRVVPPPGWRLMVGAELAESNPDADIGMERSAPPVYMWVISEPAPDTQLDALRAQIHTASIPVEGGERITLALDGQPLELQQVTAEGVPPGIEMIHGIRARAGELHQILFAFPTAGGREHMQAALDGLGFLEPSDRRALVRGLLAEPDPQAAVSGELALWGGRFRDFERGITWTKPSAEWQVDIGDHAAAAVEGATLLFALDRHGLLGHLIPIDDVQVDAHALVRGALSRMVSEGRAQQAPIHRLRMDADSSAVAVVDTETNGLHFQFVTAAAVVADQAALLIVYGLQENMEAHDADVQAAIAGLVMSREALPPFTEQDGVFTSWRHGYRIVPPPGAVRRSRTLNNARLEMESWVGPEQVVSMMITGGEGIAERADAVLRTTIVAELERMLRESNAVQHASEPQPYVVARRPGYRMSFEIEGIRTDFFAVARGEHIFMLTVEQKGPDRSEAWATQWAKGFELLD